MRSYGLRPRPEELASVPVYDVETARTSKAAFRNPHRSKGGVARHKAELIPGKPIPIPHVRIPAVPMPRRTEPEGRVDDRFAISGTERLIYGTSANREVEPPVAAPKSDRKGGVDDLLRGEGRPANVSILIDEVDPRGAPILDGRARDPAPTEAEVGPGSIVVWRPSPRIPRHPRPTEGIDPNPMTAVIGRPSGFLIGRPHPTVAGGEVPVAMPIEATGHEADITGDMRRLFFKNHVSAVVEPIPGVLGAERTHPYRIVRIMHDDVISGRNLCIPVVRRQCHHAPADGYGVRR